VNQNDQSAEDWKSGDNFDDNFDDCFGKFNDNAGSQLSTGSWVEFSRVGRSDHAFTPGRLLEFIFIFILLE